VQNNEACFGFGQDREEVLARGKYSAHQRQVRAFDCIRDTDITQSKTGLLIQTNPA